MLDRIAPDRPFCGLWSLWDMMELKAKPFLNAVRALAVVEEYLRTSTPDELKSPVTPATAKRVSASLHEFMDGCAGLGAEACRMAADELIEKLTTGSPPLRLLFDEVRHLHKYFERQLKFAKLFALNPDDAKHHDGAIAMFGDKATEAFPSTRPEIDEAGKCLALGRSAATIYHLMRIIEIALRSLGPQLEIADPQPSWNTVIRKLDSETKKEPKDRKLKVDYGFLDDISAEMHAVNRAWRRKAMHVDATFSLDNARHIFSATTSLMQHLADGGLREVAIVASPPS